MLADHDPPDLAVGGRSDEAASARQSAAFAAFPEQRASGPLDARTDARPFVGMQALLASREGAQRELLTDLIRGMGVDDLYTEASGAGALRVLHIVPVHMVVCDDELSDGVTAQALFENARAQQVLPPQTMLLALGDGRQYRATMSIAELEPDAFLIKPLAPFDVRARMLRAWSRKQALSDLHAAMLDEDPGQVVAQAMALRSGSPDVAMMASRLASGWLIEQGQAENAETMVRAVLNSQRPSWALLRLAQIRLGQERLDEAVGLLKQATRRNPRHLAALDLLAKVYERQGRHDDALACMDQLNGQTLPSLVRMRRSGRLARQVGDLVRAEGYLRWAAEHAGEDEDAQARQDNIDLVSVMLAQGRLQAAQRLHEATCQHLRGHPDETLIHALYEFDRAHDAGDAEALRAAGTQMVDALESALDVVSLPLALRAVDACCSRGLRQCGYALAAALVRSRRADRDELRQLRSWLDRFGAMPADLLPRIEIDAALRQLESIGWNPGRAQTLGRSIDYWISQPPQADGLEEARRRLHAIERFAGTAAA